MKSLLFYPVFIFLILPFSGCTPDFDNPYDPKNTEPLPLAPQNVTLTSKEDGMVTIRFEYEYSRNSLVSITRNDSIIVKKLKSGNEFNDYWTFAEDTSMEYVLTGYNNFGENDSPKKYFTLKVPPRITIHNHIADSSIDTVYNEKLKLSGRVTDPSGINTEKFIINNKKINLEKVKSKIPHFYLCWEYFSILNSGLNTIKIYSEDDSKFHSDTTVTLFFYYFGQNRKKKEISE